MGNPTGQAGTVYLLDLGASRFKIGMTTDLDRRLHELKAGNPGIKVAASGRVDDARAVESALHATFKDCRVEREVFSLSPAQVSRAWQMINSNAEAPKYTWRNIPPRKRADGSMDFLIYQGTHEEQFINARTRAEILMWKRFRLAERWSYALHDATEAAGIRYDVPIELIQTGRVIGFKIRAHEHTERLMSFLRSKNNLHLIGFDFQGQPSVSLEGQRVCVTIGLPAPLVEASVPLPLTDVYGLNEGDFLVGVDLMNKPVKGHFSDSMPHIFVAGMTGSGKTFFIRSLAYQLSQTGCQLALGDGKLGACLRGYEKLPGVVGSLAVEDNEIREMVKWVDGQMRERYQILNRGGNLDEYSPLVCVIDEISDLPADVMDSLNTIARKGRESKTHLVLSTQNPTQKNLGNDLRRNITGRVALKVEDSTASSVILPGEFDASALMGAGDCFFYDGTRPTRAQCYMLDKNEARLEMCYSPAIQWGGEQSGKPVTAKLDPYVELVGRMVSENPRVGQPKVREAIKAAGLRGIGSEKIGELLKDAKSRAIRGTN
ncbi:DNA translocase SftA [Anaerolineae bacterium]|nr:DNA translocase SftA [Anaerolineae bacterium]